MFSLRSSFGSASIDPKELVRQKLKEAGSPDGLFRTTMKFTTIWSENVNQEILDKTIQLMKFMLEEAKDLRWGDIQTYVDHGYPIENEIKELFRGRIDLDNYNNFEDDMWSLVITDFPIPKKLEVVNKGVRSIEIMATYEPIDLMTAYMTNERHMDRDPRPIVTDGVGHYFLTSFLAQMFLSTLGYEATTRFYPREMIRLGEQNTSIRRF